MVILLYYSTCWFRHMLPINYLFMRNIWGKCRRRDWYMCRNACLRHWAISCWDTRKSIRPWMTKDEGVSPGWTLAMMNTTWKVETSEEVGYISYILSWKPSVLNSSLTSWLPREHLGGKSWISSPESISHYTKLVVTHLFLLFLFFVITFSQNKW